MIMRMAVSVRVVLAVMNAWAMLMTVRVGRLAFVGVAEVVHVAMFMCMTRMIVIMRMSRILPRMGVNSGGILSRVAATTFFTH
jgi:hypothetical protein